MTPTQVANIAGAIVTVALITTAVLPNRETPAVINALGNAFSSSIRAAMGR